MGNGYSAVDRKRFVEKVDYRLKHMGEGEEKACEMVGISVSSYCRWRRHAALEDDVRDRSEPEAPIADGNGGGPARRNGKPDLSFLDFRDGVREDAPGPKGGVPFGPYLRSLRKARGLTLRQVQESSGVSNAYVSQLETGYIARPSPKILMALAPAYGSSYRDMMERAGYLPADPQPGRGANRDAVAEIVSALRALPKARRLDAMATAIRAAIDGGVL